MMVPAIDPTLGSYIAFQDAAQSQVAVPAADATYTTQHLLCVQILDSDYSGSILAGNLGIVAGTPAASPSDPALPTDGIYVPLARIIVPARATTVTNIVDLRQLISLGGTPALAYVEVTTQQTGFAQTTWGDVTGTNVSFVTPGGHRIKETMSVDRHQGIERPHRPGRRLALGLGQYHRILAKLGDRAAGVQPHRLQLAHRPLRSRHVQLQAPHV